MADPLPDWKRRRRFDLGWVRWLLVAASLAGGEPAAWAAAASEAAPGQTRTFALVAVYYLESGKPFGSTDYGLRIPKAFCMLQKDTLIQRWIGQGATRMADDVVWLNDRGYTAKLYCIDVNDYDKPSFRRHLLSRPLGK